MPWLIGDETSYRVLETTPDGLTLSSLLLDRPAYLGYLLEGFSAALAGGRFRPDRPALGFRAGWAAVAVTARTPDLALAGRLGPYLAPTAPRPHASAPLGFTLFSCRWLGERLGPSLAGQYSSLEWASRLGALIGPQSPVFCDPVLELELSHRTSAEETACRYRPANRWIGSVRAVAVTLFGVRANKAGSGPSQ